MGKDFFMFLADSTTSSPTGGTPAGNTSWIMFALIGGLLLMMIVMSFISRRRATKDAEDMLSSITVGIKVQTIGGFIGTVTAVDDEKNTLTLNIGTEESPTLVVIDKGFLRQIERPTADTATGSDDNYKSDDDVFADDKNKESTEETAYQSVESSSDECETESEEESNENE